MKILADEKTKKLLFRILLCGAAFPLAGAALLCGFPEKGFFVLGLSSLCMTVAVLVLCIRRFREQEERMENAAEQISAYILDNRRDGIACNEDGAMYHLFHEVNSLVAIANAHADREKKAKEFLRNILSDISHQMRTPLAALEIYNGILRQEATDPSTVRQFAALTEQELNRIETLIDSLLKIARLDAGAITMEFSPENVSALLEKVSRSFAFRAEQEGKAIILEGNAETTISCDCVWLTEAIGNIVKNALDHTGKGDSIVIRWRQSPTLVQIIVQDNGCGIHPEDLYHIFKRFYRSRFSKDTQGIGLGLPLAKAIVEAHQGSIEVSSQLGVGATFTLNFLIPTKL